MDMVDICLAETLEEMVSLQLSLCSWKPVSPIHSYFFPLILGGSIMQTWHHLHYKEYKQIFWEIITDKMLGPGGIT